MDGAAPASRPGVRELYRRSLKPQDLRFNVYACRPVAALLVYLLYPTRITPNQVTFLSLFLALLGDAALLFWTGHGGMVAAAVLLYVSFVFDCADGQLARAKGQTSTVGSYLDFLMDEIKAVALIAACAGRLAIDGTAMPGLPVSVTSISAVWLAIGLGGAVIAASGCSVTTFMRRPEYFEAVTGAKAERVPGFTALRPAAEKTPAPQRRLSPLLAVEWLGKLCLHYPAWFYIPAFLGRLEWFLLPYLLAHTLYLGRSGFIILLRLGK